MRAYAPGDWVIYRKSKRSATPSPRAQEIYADSKGEKYSYVVEKYWIIERVLEGDRLLLRTRRGKLVELNALDVNLRHANFIERFIHRHRFRNALEQEAVSNAAGIV